MNPKPGQTGGIPDPLSLAATPESTLSLSVICGAPSRSWLWIFLHGAALFLGGIFCLLLPGRAGVAVEIIIGAAFLSAGIISLMSAFFCDSLTRFSVVTAGILGVSIGILLLSHPFAGLFALTLCAGAAFLGQGITRLFLIHVFGGIRRQLWWSASAVIEIVLALAILSNTAAAAGWLPGTLCAMAFLLSGAATCRAALIIRNPPSLTD